MDTRSSGCYSHRGLCHPKYVNIVSHRPQTQSIDNTVASVWFFAFLSDFFRTRWTLILAMALIGGVSTLILTIWNVSLGAKYYACECIYRLVTGPQTDKWTLPCLWQTARARCFGPG